jgi:uncharacterized protein
MEIAGYIASVLIGISLGLIGGGGSILTVPVLVYLFGISPLLATSYSLFIVGSTSLVGAYNNWRQGAISLRTVGLFGLTSIATVFLTREVVVHAIPHHLFYIGSFDVTLSLLTMVLFAVLMIAAGLSMVSASKTQGAEKSPHSQLLTLLLYGVGVGLITGFLGAGGGFLIIPALVLLVGLPMKKAIGTSLLIIALNSSIGFLGDLHHMHVNWPFLLSLSAMAILGIFIGGRLGKKIPGTGLRRAFGWFVLAMGIVILVIEMVRFLR